MYTSSYLCTLFQIWGYRTQRGVNGCCHLSLNFSIYMYLAEAPRHILGSKGVRSECKNLILKYLCYFITSLYYANIMTLYNGVITLC